MFSLQLEPKSESQLSHDQKPGSATPQWVAEGKAKAGANQNYLNEALEQSTGVNEYESIVEITQGRAVNNDYGETPPRDHEQSERDQDAAKAKYAVGDEHKGGLVQIG